MTRRTANGRSWAAAALAAAVLLLAACGGSGGSGGSGSSGGSGGSGDDASRDQAGPAASRTGQAPGPAGEGPDAVDRASPGATSAGYFEAVRDARFGDACALLAPVVLARYASAGQDCQTELASLFDETTRAAIGDVTADEEQVQVVGDTATVPGTALTRTDLPEGADAPSFPNLRATRLGEDWYLLPD